MPADLPIVVEAVDTQEKFDAIMPKIDELMDEHGGMVTLEKATVIRYTEKTQRKEAFTLMEQLYEDMTICVHDRHTAFSIGDASRNCRFLFNPHYRCDSPFRQSKSIRKRPLKSSCRQV